LFIDELDKAFGGAGGSLSLIQTVAPLPNLGSFSLDAREKTLLVFCDGYLANRSRERLPSEFLRSDGLTRSFSSIQATAEERGVLPLNSPHVAICARSIDLILP
jgi:hypothetical protein